MKPSLASIWSYALEQVSPGALIQKNHLRERIPEGSALLFWGKAARATSEALSRSSRGKRFGPRFVISPETGEHPIPGEGSFRSGERLLEFMDLLRRRQVRNLTVFLSGGASSLAWLKPKWLGEQELKTRLLKLYRRPVSIEKMNIERSRLCLLKAGGTSRLLRLLAPEVRVEVYVLSDVAPFGMNVVGSGPWVGRAHQLLASNRDLVAAARKAIGNQKIFEMKHSMSGSEESWVRDLSKQVRRKLSESQKGWILWGGEPTVRLSGRKVGKGGRQCQIAARLALNFWEEIQSGRLEILCASSDGLDGNSGAAAVYLQASGRALPMTSTLRRQLKKAIVEFNTAPFLKKSKWIIPSRETGTNLQDLVLIRIS